MLGISILSYGESTGILTASTAGAKEMSEDKTALRGRRVEVFKQMLIFLRSSKADRAPSWINCAGMVAGLRLHRKCVVVEYRLGSESMRIHHS